MTVNDMTVTITRHAKERYAERIMDRDNPTDVAVFIRDHEDKIQHDIEKMLEYGTLLYEGPSSKDMKRDVGVTINGSWVVIWDTREFVVITLYCIDLGVGSEVNDAFIKNAISQIDEAKKSSEEVSRRVAADSEEYLRLIEGWECSLVEYKKRVKELEQCIAGGRQMINAFSVDKQIAEDRVREKVEVLIGRQKF